MSAPTRGPELLAVNIAFITTAVIAYSLRCFVRIKMVKAFGIDDYLMGLAMVFFLFYIVASNIGIRYGTGMHHADLSAENVERATHCWWFCYIFYCWAMIFAKFSIGFLLLRISFRRIHTWILYAAMLTSVVAGGAFFLVTVFQCNPVSYFWAKKGHSGTCVNNDLIIGLAYLYSAFSIISDFTFAIIPGFLVWNLQLKRRAKIALIPLITMGCIASAAVIARLPFVGKFNSPDFLWATLDIAIWSTIEQGLAITAGSLATLRPLFFLAMHQLGISTAPTGQRPSNYGNSGNMLGGTNPKSQPKSQSRSDHFRPDSYKLSAVVETNISQDSESKLTDFPKSPNWFHNGFPPLPLPKDIKESRDIKESKKLTKKSTGDNESEKSLKIRTGRDSEEEDPMHIMVSKSFYITDEERSLAPRESPFK
ncbi:hypothetical protein GQ44DRAFT_770849 [Phaeosphaeriaceae sp. PMI808]|nr:hypothetical protein GQ44DRAFT_770849 [Phaeosphaeriaceae sp. PMI808]